MKTRFVISFLTFTICLLIGIQLGNHAKSPPDTRLLETRPLVNSPSQQRSIVFIAADDLQSSEPRLVGVWLVLYRPDVPSISLLSLYPSQPSATSTQKIDLAAAFSLTKEGAPSSSFFKALQDFHFNWNGYLLIDDTGVAAIIDWMQGITVDNQTIGGIEALNGLIRPWENTRLASETQRDYLMSACKRMAQLPADSNWTSLLTGLMPQHLRTDLSFDLILSDWKRLVSGPDPFSCEFP